MKKSRSKSSKFGASSGLAALVLIFIVGAAQSEGTKQTSEIPYPQQSEEFALDDVILRAEDLASDMIADLYYKSNTGTEYPDVLYDIQSRTNLVYDFAVRHKLYQLANNLLSLYIKPVSFLCNETHCASSEKTGLGRHLSSKVKKWTNSTGQEDILVSSQFLYLIAHTIRKTLSLPSEERLQQSQHLVELYPPVLAEHYRRWVLADDGSFQVRAWGCTKGLFNHRNFLRAKSAQAFGRPMIDQSKPTLSFCNAITDEDLWVVAGVTEMLMAHQLDPRQVPLPVNETIGYQNYLAVANTLIVERLFITELVDFEGQPATGIDFEPGAWRDHQDHRYSGYTGDIFPEDNSAFPIANPDFEEAPWHGDIPGWRTRNTALVRTTDGFNGIYVLEGTHESTTSSHGIFQHIGVIPQQLFRAFAHVRVPGDASATVEAAFFGDNGALIGAQKASIDPRGLEGWQRIEVNGVTPDAAKHAKFAVQASTSASIDAVRFLQSRSTEDPTPPVKVIEPSSDPTGAWDLSHARRFVNVFRTLFEAQEILGSNASANYAVAGLARQLAYSVFNRDFARPRFTNYFDGTNGWYRVNYGDRTGFGYPPWSGTASFFTGGFCALRAFDEGLNQVCQGVLEVALHDGPAYFLKDCVVENYLSQECKNTKEHMLQFLSAFSL